MGVLQRAVVVREATEEAEPPSGTGPTTRPAGAALLLVTGFLGSGKTTLIMGVAREAAARGVKTAFIVNEIGEIGVDQEVMRDGGLEVYELTAGCICCQIGTDLVRTLEILQEVHHPRLIVVEATGIATPRGVVDALGYYGGPPFLGVHNLGVLDPTRLEPLLEVMTPLIESQIREVQEIVISKIDEATSGEVVRAREEAERLNPRARVSALSALDRMAVRELARRLFSPEAWRDATDASGPTSEQQP